MSVRTLSGLGRTLEIWDDMSEQGGQQLEAVQLLDELPEPERPQEPHRVQDGGAHAARGYRHGCRIAVPRPVGKPARHARAILTVALAENLPEARLFPRHHGGIEQREPHDERRRKQRLTDCEAETEDSQEVAQVQRITNDGVRAFGRQLTVLAP